MRRGLDTFSGDAVDLWIVRQVRRTEKYQVGPHGQLVRATDLLLEDVDLVLAALKRRAYEHRLTPTVGRSHAIHAEPTTFGLKLAGHYAEFQRAKERLAMPKFEIATSADSVAVGTFANEAPEEES